MQQEGGGGSGGGGKQSHQYGEMSSAPVGDAAEQLVVEAASPISSRPPAAGGGGNLDEFMRLASVGGGDELGLGVSGGGGGVGGGASGNRWPRQETLALLKIRSDMDATFRDATVKGPLWEDVSRKLAELGYKRSAKKCREKFENVHKYYKRTKETRAGRQDGKSYKFFSELEAFHSTPATTHANVSLPVTPPTATLDVAPVSVGFPMPISSAARIIPPTTVAISMSSSLLPMPGSAPALVSFPLPQPAVAPVSAPVPPITTTAAPFGISFSSNSSTFSQGFDDDDEDDDVQEPSSMAGTSRKRKRSLSKRGSSSTTKKMMEFMEGLMKQVMQKQESMQQRFLGAIEKREQDRNIREEAWKRQESERLTREHELMAQERAIAASRDAAIISFLQKITGQTIQLPTTVIIPSAAPPPPSQPTVSIVQPAAPITIAPPLQTPPPPPQQQQSHVSHHQHQHQHQHQQQPISSEIEMATPERQVRPSDMGSSGSLMTESASSRWPKTEVLALINLRSGLKSRYQEAGPKGPLWEEISAGMLRLGYKRNPKRCKEKWENINKYFKNDKESNKQRPEDAKTCPYFHQLDALYRNKILVGETSSGSFSDHNRPQDETSQPNPPPSMAAPQQSQHETGGTPNVVTNKEGNDGSAKKPKDIVRELMEQQQQHQGQSLLVDGYDKMAEPDSDNMDDDDDDEMEEQKKMGYKIEFQRQNSSTPNGGGHNGARSAFTMVQ